MEEARLGNCGQVLGGNVQFNRGGGGGTHQGGGGVQITRATAGLVIRRLARITAQHQEDKEGVEAAREVNSERGCGAGNIGKVLPCGSSGGDLVWSGDMGAYSKNDAEVRESACEYPAEGHT